MFMDILIIMLFCAMTFFVMYFAFYSVKKKLFRFRAGYTENYSSIVQYMGTSVRNYGNC